MDYEQKYKEALNKAQRLSIDGFLDAVAISDIFPELQENEDERIRKVLLNDFKNNCSEYYCDGVNRDMIINWLEKQGEKKLIENVETKFCEGDKVVSNQDGKVYTVGTAYWVNGDNICLHGTDGNHKWTNEDDLNKNYHLCDAKKLDADNVWLQNYLSNVICFVNQFKKDFGL